MLSVYDSELVASLKDKALLEKKQVLNHLFSNQKKTSLHSSIFRRRVAYGALYHNLYLQGLLNTPCMIDNGPTQPWKF